MTLPLNLCRVITWLPVGGIERRLVAVLPKLRDRGWTVRLVCLRSDPGPLAESLRDAGISVEVIPFRSRLSPMALWRLKAFLEREKITVVHSHMYRANVPATIAGTLAGVPVRLGQIHNVDSWDGPRQEAMDRFLVRHRTATLTVSRAVQEDVGQRLGVAKRRLPVLHNGIDMKAFRPDSALRDAMRASLGIAADDVVFLVPARLHPNKYPLETLAAFLGACPDGRSWLLFAGDGPLREEVEARASGHDRVKVLGSRSDMAALYNAADVILLHSRREGFSNAVIEALACGKPVIAADVGGNREAIDRPGVGWIHPAGDLAALRIQVIEAEQRGVAGLAAMAGACRERAGAFSLEQMIEQTDALYRRYLSEVKGV